MNDMKIVAVVVTFNRFEKLKKTLAAYEAQFRSVDDLVIVDNYSTDGTREFLREWQHVKGVSNRHVVYMDENLGGAGGFHDGCEYALTLNPDWIFVADDDAYPESDVFKLFESFVSDHDTKDISAICSSVLNMDGSYAYHHRRNVILRKFGEIQICNSTDEEYKTPYFLISSFSYVGTFMRAKSLRKVGLCNRDFFIYYDDSEHAMRMQKVGRMLCVPSIKLFHDDAVVLAVKNKNEEVKLWRRFYGYRNACYSYLHHFPLAGLRTIMGIIKNVYMAPSSTKEEKKMIKTALWDAFIGRLGKHPVYRP